MNCISVDRFNVFLLLRAYNIYMCIRIFCSQAWLGEIEEHAILSTEAGMGRYAWMHFSCFLTVDVLSFLQSGRAYHICCIQFFWMKNLSLIFLWFLHLKVLSEYPEATASSEQQSTLGETFPELVKRLDEGLWASPLPIVFTVNLFEKRSFGQ